MNKSDQNFFCYRPNNINQFIGSKEIKEYFLMCIEAARKRNEPLDHVILYGPPGLGKTTLAKITAKEMGAGFKATTAPVLSRPCDITSILTNLEDGDILFIDEIHRLNKNIEEILYSAMEDYTIDVMIGKGPSAQTIKIDLAKFTLIGATTMIGNVSKPLRDRFGITLKLEPYSIDELTEIIKQFSSKLGIECSSEAAYTIAERSRGTPRIAIKITKRVRDLAMIRNLSYIDNHTSNEMMNKMGLDNIGLDNLDRQYLKFIMNNYCDKPVGVETIASALSENKENLENVVEPYLIQLGMIQKTLRGRKLSEIGMKYCSTLD